MIREGKLGKKEQVKENTMELEEQKERRGVFLWFNVFFLSQNKDGYVWGHPSSLF